MDNNGSEPILRIPVVGRKNHYGSVTRWSARLTAVMFSVFETLALWQINELKTIRSIIKEDTTCMLNRNRPSGVRTARIITTGVRPKPIEHTARTDAGEVVTSKNLASMILSRVSTRLPDGCMQRYRCQDGA